jgi:BCD family chlorophyll transporter-like MFS transporter
MKRLNDKLARGWIRVGIRLLPFADAATPELPLPRLLRLSLFQVSFGMAVVLLVGTLNRVMIVELNVPAALVALMVSLPLVFAPLRAFFGFRSDTHRSALGWRRVPYIWMGTLLQFGGLAIMPFALIVLSGDSNGPAWAGDVAAALAFLMVGAGLHVTQTAGLALATDLAPAHARPRVVALLYVMLLIGMVCSAVVFGQVLSEFSQLKLIQVIQGAALLSMVLNLVALWKQEARDPSRTANSEPRPAFVDTWSAFIRVAGARRFLCAVGLGSAAFSMQDILLEPYGGEILHLSVGATTALTGLFAAGALAAFALSAKTLSGNAHPCRLAAYGAVVGVFAFAAVILAAPLDSTTVFRAGTILIGFGGGLFAAGTLSTAMSMDSGSQNGLALGAWGAVQATAAGGAIALGGVIRDLVADLASNGLLGTALGEPAVGYSVVYHLEIFLLFATLVAIGPLARFTAENKPSPKFGLAEFPG